MEDTKVKPASFAGGMFGGMIGVGATFPLDTIRVWYQTAPSTDKSVFGMTKRIVRKEGLGALYRGMRAPVIGVGLEKFLVFGFYDHLQRLHQFESSFLNTVVSGIGSGLICTTVVVPVERIKILRQKNIPLSLKTMSVRSLYQGWSSTLLREVPGYGIYFGTYEMLNRYNLSSSPLQTAFYGGLSGVASWLVIYPSDPVKTMIQKSKLQLKFRHAATTIYNTHGISGFYRGMSQALIRAFCLHSIVFMVYGQFIQMFE